MCALCPSRFSASVANWPTSLSVCITQLQNGTGSRFGHHLSSSSSSALRAGGTVSSDHAGDIHISTAACVEPTYPSSDRSLPPRQPDGPVGGSQGSSDHHRHHILPQGEDQIDLGGGKRKLPSPERAVRQTALPQPQSGRERREEEEEAEEEQLQQWPDSAIEEEVLWSSESHRLQDSQEQSQRSRATSGGKKTAGGGAQKHQSAFYCLNYSAVCSVFTEVYKLAKLTLRFGENDNCNLSILTFNSDMCYRPWRGEEDGWMARCIFPFFSNWKYLDQRVVLWTCRLKLAVGCYLG